MPYITVNAPIRYHQITLEELLDAPPGAMTKAPVGKLGDTKTYWRDTVPERLNKPEIIATCYRSLEEFISRNRELYTTPRHELYHSFSIPKRTHGFRNIDAPLPPLMNALRELKCILETYFFASHHTSAFAYVENRCAVDAVKRHQSNKSRWFLKIDFSNFFGTTTKKFVFDTLSTIWPFSELMKDNIGYIAVTGALDLAFLDDVLPQGTPISPLLTNLVMIPIDHCLMNNLRNFNGQRLIYTRYADDIDISSRFEFDVKEVMSFVRKTIKDFHAPYVIKDEKTHYGSNSGRNWILGVMYNKDFKLTVGHKKKDALRAQLSCYIKDKLQGTDWTLNDVQHMNGLLAYCKKIEPDYIDGILKHYGQKYNCNVMNMIRSDLRNL